MSAGIFAAPPLSSPVDGRGQPVLFDEAMLWAGDLVVSTQPIRMNTVLGSCVSICLFDAERHYGGMNHYLVPRGNRSAIHGDWATEQLIERMRALGSGLHNLQAKVFGGGSPLKLANESLAIGDANVAVALEVLATFGIPVVAQRVGLDRGLRLFFENWTGVVWARQHAKGYDNGE